MKNLLPALALLFAGYCLAAPTLEQGYDAFERGDVDGAVQIWRELATQGNTTAQVNLGQLYRMGKGVEPDDREAVKWYSMAVRQGSETAKYNLILMHTEGRATRGDLDMAFAEPMTAQPQGPADAPAPTIATAPPPEASAKPPVKTPPETVATAPATPPASALAAAAAATEPVTQSVARPAAKPVTTAAPAKPGPAKKPGTNWFEQLPSPQYVLQLASSPHRRQLERYAKEKLADTGKNPQVVLTSREDRNHYLLLLGPYNTSREARAVIATLPAQVQKSKPWARLVAAVQKAALEDPAADPQNWFAQLPVQQYVLQLVSSRYQKSLRDYTARHLGEAGMSAQIVPTTLKGRNNYLLLLGPFDTPGQARGLIAALPAEVQNNKPYARSVVSVQQMAK